jgi:hypothetical protein
MHGYGTVFGIIKDFDEHNLVNVTVYLVDEHIALSTITGLDGKYKLENVPVGIRTLKYVKPGYNTVIMRTIVLPDDTPNAPLTNRIDLYLEGPTITTIENPLRNSTVFCTIRNITGMPLANVTLQIVEHNLTGYTDLTGNLTFAEVPPGRATINATCEGYNNTVYEIFIRPGMNETLNLTMKLGNISTVDTYRITDTYRIHGRIFLDTDDTMNAIAGVSAVQVRISELGLCNITSPNGTFALDTVPIGIYNLEVHAENYGILIIENITVHESNLNITNMTITLKDCLESTYIDRADLSGFYLCAGIELFLAMLVLAGCIYAWRRKMYGVVLVGAFCGILTFAGPVVINIPSITAITTNQILGLIAVILTMRARREFT